MKVRRYTPQDKTQIDSWYSKRNLEIIPDSLLPEVGFIIDNVAAGFLYKTDGGIALIENYITSPDVNYVDRDLGLEEVTKALIENARESGFDRVMAITTLQSVYTRALSHGFDDYGNFRILNKVLKAKGN